MRGWTSAERSEHGDQGARGHKATSDVLTKESVCADDDECNENKFNKKTMENGKSISQEFNGVKHLVDGSLHLAPKMTQAWRVRQLKKVLDRFVFHNSKFLTFYIYAGIYLWIKRSYSVEMTNGDHCV
jgi:hypothetical protein